MVEELAQRLPDLGQEGVDLRAERACYLDARLAFLHGHFSVGLGLRGIRVPQSNTRIIKTPGKMSMGFRLNLSINLKIKVSFNRFEICFRGVKKSLHPLDFFYHVD